MHDGGAVFMINRMHPDVRQTRGQSLVLFSAFVLLLTLMVLTTLSLGHLERTKMELQVAADTAAYSQAVATARAFNSVALLNRAQVATMVALAGVSGAISFAATYRGALNAVWYAYVEEFDTEYCRSLIVLPGTHFDPNLMDRMCDGRVFPLIGYCSDANNDGNDSFDRQNCNGRSCVVTYEIFGTGIDPATGLNGQYNPDSRMNRLWREMERVKGVWQALDDAAGKQAFDINLEAIKYNQLQSEVLAEATSKLSTFSHAAVAPVNGTWAPGAVGVAVREFDAAQSGASEGSSVEITMGSRAHPFTNARVDGERAIETRIKTVLGAAGSEVTFNLFTGNSYFAASKNHGARPAEAFAAFADEESSVSVDYAGPSRFVVAGKVGASGHQKYAGWVRSTDEQNTIDNHKWCPTQNYQSENQLKLGGGQVVSMGEAPDTRHTMPPHYVPPPPKKDPCKNYSCMWPGYHDTNADLVDNPSDVFGQPKLFAGASKDLSTDVHPWNVAFRFHGMATGAGATIDLKKSDRQVHGVTSTMESLAAGMAYYHRPGHWKEPPNLFNPYWRATLVRANIDSVGVGKNSTFIDDYQAASPTSASTLRQLVEQGYRGIP